MSTQQFSSGERETQTSAPEHLGRRNFLSKLGGAAALSAFVVSCTTKSDLTDMGQDQLLSDAARMKSGGQLINFGKGDIAILNYAFLLEQLEAAFYTKVTSNFFKGAQDKTKMRLEQIRDHEIAHREFFKTVLGTAAIPDQMFDFSSIDFTDRMSVLSHAQAFEDTGVGAYNGVGEYIKNQDYLLLAGKIVSVEARHAAYIRDLLQPTSFANGMVVDMNGLDLATKPAAVAVAIKPYLTANMNLQSLPL